MAGFFILLISLNVSSQTKDTCNRLAKLSFLKINATPVKVSNVSLAEKYGFLKSAIGNKRIVMLGEHSHTDGASLVSISEVVQYLHQEMGFEVLVIEAPFFDIDIKKRFSRDYKSFIDIASHPLPLTFYELMEYYWRCKAGNKPLLLEGGDIFFSREDLPKIIAEIDSLANITNPMLAKSQQWNQCWNHITQRSLIESDSAIDKFRNNCIFFIERIRGSKADGYVKEALIQRIECILGTIKSNQFIDQNKLEKDDSERSVKIIDETYDSTTGLRTVRVEEKLKDPYSPLSQFDSISTEYYLEINKIRDEYIGKNILYLIEQKYPGKKIIINFSGYHISRNISPVQQQMKYLKTAIPMGQFIYNRHKDELYTICFPMYSGVRGFSLTLTGDPKDGKVERQRTIRKASPCSIEGLLKDAFIYKYGNKHVNYAAFLDLSKTSKMKGGEWLKEENEMEPTFVRPYKADWTNIYDGIFFIREMHLAYVTLPFLKFYKKPLPK